MAHVCLLSSFTSLFVASSKHYSRGCSHPGGVLFYALSTINLALLDDHDPLAWLSLLSCVGELNSGDVMSRTFLSQIADFGTSRWMQHNNSTGLATYSTRTHQNTHMSIAWSAPEVGSLHTPLRLVVPACHLHTAVTAVMVDRIRSVETRLFLSSRCPLQGFTSPDTRRSSKLAVADVCSQRGTCRLQRGWFSTFFSIPCGANLRVFIRCTSDL